MFGKRNTITAFILIFVAMIFFGCLSLTACSKSKIPANEQNGAESDNQTIPNEEEDDNGMKHYEIDLSMQNFDDFLEYEYTYSYLGVSPQYPNSKGHSYLVTGVLSFAYYQNVIVTFRMTKNDTNQYRDFNVKLNAAGNGGFYQADQIYKETTTQLGGGYGFTVSIQNVSGTVIFDM